MRGFESHALRDAEISTHTPLAGRDGDFTILKAYSAISTHTPLAGRDLCDSGLFHIYNISTHTPLAGRDAFAKQNYFHDFNFYSHAPRGA